MNSIEIVKAYYTALDSGDMEQADQYLSEDYHLVDFTPQPMDRSDMIEMMNQFKTAFPNLKHSLSNIRVEENLVKVTVQLSGTHSEPLELQKLGVVVVPRSRKFLIFPHSYLEFTVHKDKITLERDISPISPNRRMSGLLKEMGVNVAKI